MKVKLSNLSSMPDAPSTTHQQEPATILFADIGGSTRLFEQYGNLRARQIETRVLDLLAARTVAHQGTVIKTIGDEIMSSFPSAEAGIQAACEMQKGIKNDLALADLNIAIRIGLHHGPVLVEKNDVFGDAVNVAARMVQLAKSDQIITTRETMRGLPSEFEPMTRELGRAHVRGKQDEIEIVEIIWFESTSMTQMSDVESEKILRNKLYARLLLVYRGQNIELKPSTDLFNIGRGPRNDLIIDRELVSRSHAIIEFRQGKFILADHSTNGTYLMLENGSRFFVRREEITLHDQGIICLGQTAFKENPDIIHYECQYAA